MRRRRKRCTIAVARSSSTSGPPAISTFRRKERFIGDPFSKETLATVAGKDDEIVFSCMGRHCPWSAYASAKALLWGYTHVDRFAGGFPAWQDAGYPIETAAGQ